MQLDLEKYADDVEVGFASGLSRGRTITETDVVTFMMLTGNWAEIHSNVEFARETKFGQRLVQGSLILAISQGLFSFGVSVAAFYGLDGLTFRKPVFIGDTVYARGTVVELREKDDSFGLVTWQMDVVNQRQELVQTSRYTNLTYRRATDVPGSGSGE